MADEAKVRIPTWQVLFTIVFWALFPLVTIVIGGDWRWSEGWIFVVVLWFFSAVTSARMYFKDPALFRERFSSPVQKDQKAWDKIVIFLVIISYLVWLIVTPLDARRFVWSPEFPVWLEAIGFVMTVVGFTFFYLTFKENTFAAPVVKIMEERKQRVISTGVYGLVRHPLYLGASLYATGGSILMGSVYGMIAAVVFTTVLAVRSVGEEDVLRKELEGYDAYMRRVRWRMFPLIF